MDKPTTKEVARFFDKVQITDTCWWWKVTKGQRIYGQFGFNGKTVKAHRFSYELFVGPIETGKQILHRQECGNPSCVNPNHLYMGTHQDNMRDMRLWGNANFKMGVCKMGGTYLATGILEVAGAVYYRLDYLINSGQVTPIGMSNSRERIFSKAEALKAIDLLRGKKSNVEELKELANK